MKKFRVPASSRNRRSQVRCRPLPHRVTGSPGRLSQNAPKGPRRPRRAQEGPRRSLGAPGAPGQSAPHPERVWPSGAGVVPQSSRNRRSQVRSRPLPLAGAAPHSSVCSVWVLWEAQEVPGSPRSGGPVSSAASTDLAQWFRRHPATGGLRFDPGRCLTGSPDHRITCPRKPQETQEVPGGPRPVSLALGTGLAQWSRRRLAAGGLRLDPGR